MNKARQFAEQMARYSTIPAFAFATIPVLLLRGAFVFVAPDATPYWSDFLAGDIRSWWKAVMLCGIAVWMLVLAAIRLLGGWRPRERVLPLLLGVTAGTTLASSLFSDYPETSWLGYSFHYEGAFALFAYLVGVWYVAEMSGEGCMRVWLLRALGIVALINAGIGFSEGIDSGLWEGEFGRWLMGVSGLSVTYNFAGARMASGTIFQPNHYGMLMATLGIVALGMVFCERRGWRAFWGATLAATFCALLFSNSRAGILVFVFVAAAFLVAKAVAYRRTHGGLTSRQALLYAVSVLVAAALLGSSAQVRDAVSRIAARTAVLSDPHKKDYLVKSAGLENNRIRIRLEDRTLSLSRRGNDSWTLGQEGGGARDRAVSASGTDERGWSTLAIPGLDGGSLTWNRQGNVRLEAPDTRMDFFAVGQRLFVADSHYRLYPELALSDYRANGLEGLFSARGYIWRRTLEVFRDNPWFGTGPGTYIMAFPNQDLLNKYRYGRGQDEDKGHGIWASFLVQLGVIGVMLYGLSAGYVIAVAVRRGGDFSALLVAGMAAYLICSLTNDSTVGVTPVYCVLAGLAVANARDSKA